MDIQDIMQFEMQQRYKVEMTLRALNDVQDLDKALATAQRKAMTPKQVVQASRKRKRIKALAKQLVQAI